MAADSAQKFHGLAGKTAVITGGEQSFRGILQTIDRSFVTGASGIGEAYVRALVDSGVHVCFGDKDIAAGARLASGLPTTRFVSCDVSKWEDQVHLFEEAAKFSPSKKVHYVVANAGIAPKDDVFAFEGPEGPPKKPDLKTIDVNLVGGLYTVKLAMHYFIQQNGIEKRPDQEDTCLVLIGSGAAFLDIPRGPSYPATKWALRGVMHSLRRTAFYHGSRVNMISPWYVRTGILSRDQFDQVEKSGVTLAEASDAARALLHILQDNGINGRSFFIAPKKWAPQGYIDLDIDDYSGNKLLQEIQAEQIAPAPVELGLFRV
ncbi:hypothetical protein PFICI_12273 [Pestalotiopsis fici W106-1]|uniref:5'-hydroxyaverantin dehydrogenase n=1 Tax=Pestalotiopsis fici (strain W106-1 / CGMCC3.15140) TaxID=1229662 RepID=W3WNG8_PESFW|nr:uncharacterized protein PFICI_12273 [Pestalotiopsis fici W106-1]ETS75329.1 hypothetical protein PFICI_12273 [Pestalotiopsis fici W106-1]